VPRIKPRANTGGRRILVVDDNVDGAETMGALLAAQGHDVRVYSDPAEALVAALADPPQVAFLDINMPEMDGIELARHLRATPWGAELRLVAVTGLGRTTDIERTREAGFDAHLTKPADPERIIALAAAQLGDEHAVLPFSRPKSSRE
jgi:CheY-like chemotaxis protein